MLNADIEACEEVRGSRRGGRGIKRFKVATATISIRFYQVLLEIMRGCICAILWIDIIPNKDDICSNADIPKLSEIAPLYRKNITRE